MKHVYELSEAQLEQPSLVTIGVFDGVHRGHQYLIKQLVARGQQTGFKTAVLTFFPHPDVVLRHLDGRYYLTTPEERAEQLAALGVDLVITQTFDEAFRQTRASDLIDQLLKSLQMRILWVGPDFAMGYQREGTVAFLRGQGAEKGFRTEVIDLIRRDGEAISSTAIRKALVEGDVDKANFWLGRGYAVTGEVVQGDRRGHTIGFPTANLAVWEEHTIPANGVYAGWAHLDNERFMAVTNVGVRPTFDGQEVRVEAHLLDFNRDIYGQQMTVSFEHRLREEKKFENVQQLKDQIAADSKAGRDYLVRVSRP